MSKELKKINKELQKQLQEALEKNKEYEETLIEIVALMEDESEESELEQIDETLFKERYIYLYDDISQDSLSQIVSIIDYFNTKDKDIAIHERIPITIKIGTYGGEAYEAIGIIDAIQDSKTPIHAHVDGKAMSAGIMIWASAHTRSMGKNAVLMYHQVRTTGIGGTLEEIKKSIKELNRVQSVQEKVVSKNLGIPIKKLKKYNKRNQDWFIDYEKAKKYKMLT